MKNPPSSRVVQLNNRRGTVTRHIKDPQDNPLKNSRAQKNRHRSERPAAGIEGSALIMIRGLRTAP